MSSASGVSSIISAVTGAADTTSSNIEQIQQFISSQRMYRNELERQDRQDRLAAQQQQLDMMQQKQDITGGQMDLQWRRSFRNALANGTAQKSSMKVA